MPESKQLLLCMAWPGNNSVWSRWQLTRRNSAADNQVLQANNQASVSALVVGEGCRIFQDNQRF